MKHEASRGREVRARVAFLKGKYLLGSFMDHQRKIAKVRFSETLFHKSMLGILISESRSEPKPSSLELNIE